MDSNDSLAGAPLRKRSWKRFWWLSFGAVLGIGGIFLFQIISLVRKQADKASARCEVVNLVRCLKAYEMEYDRLPVPDGTEGDYFATTTDEAFLAVLLGVETTDLNPRGKVFYSGRVGHKGCGGLVTEDPLLGPRLLDPWGRVYYFRIDADNDGEVTAPDGQSVRQSVIAWSLGDGGVFDAKKLPKSW